MALVLFEDIFDVKGLNENGKKFDRGNVYFEICFDGSVDRLHCKGTTFDVDLVLDINSELFTVKSGERITIAFSSSLSLDGSPDSGEFDPSGGPSLMDAYDYVMHGRVFGIRAMPETQQTQQTQQTQRRVEVMGSCGGLLLRLRGEQNNLDNFAVDHTFYILMRKGGADNFTMDI